MSKRSSHRKTKLILDRANLVDTGITKLDTEVTPVEPKNQIFEFLVDLKSELEENKLEIRDSEENLHTEEETSKNLSTLETKEDAKLQIKWYSENNMNTAVSILDSFKTPLELLSYTKFMELPTNFKYLENRIFDPMEPIKGTFWFKKDLNNYSMIQYPFYKTQIKKTEIQSYNTKTLHVPELNFSMIFLDLEGDSVILHSFKKKQRTHPR